MVCGKDNNTKLTSFLPKLLKDKEAYAKMSKACNPYGDGHACERIADILEDKVY